ncbi:MAG: ATP-binding protein [Methanomicrobiales archaeon]|nr:ATP-binding protein [Methanomicrobiales archaeon]
MDSLPNPYSPEHPAPPAQFAGRRAQLTVFHEALADILAARPRNLAVPGAWGTGKTSLLLSCAAITAAEHAAFAPVALGGGIRGLPDLCATVAAQLGDAVQHHGVAETMREYLDTVSVSVHLGPMKMTRYPKHAADPLLLRFRETLTAAADHSPFIVAIDNAEYLQKIDGALMELRNAFQEVQSSGKSCMLLLAGSPNLFADRSIAAPASRFFEHTDLEAFSAEETREALTLPLGSSGVSMSDDCINAVHTLAAGHPWMVILTAYTLFRVRKTDRISETDLATAFPMIQSSVGRQVFDVLYRNAGENGQQILRSFARTDAVTLSSAEIAEISGVSNPHPYLGRMCERDPPLLEKVSRGKYRLAYPLLHAYLERKMREE